MNSEVFRVSSPQAFDESVALRVPRLSEILGRYGTNSAVVHALEHHGDAIDIPKMLSAAIQCDRTMPLIAVEHGFDRPVNHAYAWRMACRHGASQVIRWCYCFAALSQEEYDDGCAACIATGNVACLDWLDEDRAVSREAYGRAWDLLARHDAVMPVAGFEWTLKKFGTGILQQTMFGMAKTGSAELLRHPAIMEFQRLRAHSVR